MERSEDQASRLATLRQAIGVLEGRGGGTAIPEGVARRDGGGAFAAAGHGAALGPAGADGPGGGGTTMPEGVARRDGGTAVSGGSASAIPEGGGAAFWPARGGGASVPAGLRASAGVGASAPDGLREALVRGGMSASGGGSPAELARTSGAALGPTGGGGASVPAGLRASASALVPVGLRAAPAGSGHASAPTPSVPSGAASPDALDLGVADVDRRLGAGGLAFGALHELACDESRDVGVVAGFAAALVARLLDRRVGRVLWITTAEARREGGLPHAPGFAAFGLDPGRLVEVAAERPEEALWAFEEGLACRGTAAVVAEIPARSAALDFTATRRLALRASRDGGAGPRGFGLLLCVGGAARTTAAATRWRVGAVPSRSLAGFASGLGRPAFRLDLEKNRDGRLGRFDIEWNAHERIFATLPALRGAAAAPPSDRPAASAGGGRVLAFDRGTAHDRGGYDGV
ncbi:ImuA family protein [Siculibacillus lacustris]|uniref:ImuA family protein n=1 Tax=Siculibacillus lacustris TaxID=1549641 RepID=UPI001D18C8CC|nr:hypothetical protein [Siculibacillus lacustris]